MGLADSVHVKAASRSWSTLPGITFTTAFVGPYPGSTTVANASVDSAAEASMIRALVAVLPKGYTGGWKFLYKAIVDSQEEVRRLTD
jgi:hypothetical protein